MNEREELLRCIGEICRARPDLRLGQLLCNLTALGRGDTFGDVWEAEDHELIEPARQLAATLNDSAITANEIGPPSNFQARSSSLV